MADINLDFLTQFPRLVTEVININKELKQESKDKRINFFDNEIMPVHNKMYEINQDYLTNFLKLENLVRINIKNKEKLKHSVCEEIEKMRLTKLAERSELKAFSKVLKEINKKDYIKNYELELFIDYANSIEYYFNAFTDNHNNPDLTCRNTNFRHQYNRTHYTSFMYIVRQIIKDKKTDLHGNLIELFQAALYIIPEHYDVYYESFLRLKINYCY